MAPNSYRRTKADVSRWASWLRKNTEVGIISRDFSMTSKNSRNQAKELSGMVDLLKLVDRPMHILIQGIGEANAPETVCKLAEVGVTCSIFSGQPAMLARKGEVLVEGDVGRVREHALSRADLGIRNFGRLEDRLVRLAGTLPVYSDHPSRNRLRVEGRRYRRRAPPRHRHKPAPSSTKAADSNTTQ